MWFEITAKALKSMVIIKAISQEAHDDILKKMQEEAEKRN